MSKITMQELDEGLIQKLNEIFELKTLKDKIIFKNISNTKPTTTDDISKGYKQGDVWVYENYISEEEYEFVIYQCVDNKMGASKWIKYLEDIAIPQKIYGVRVDESNSNPNTRVTYIRDAIGMTPAKGNNGNFSYGSWKDTPLLEGIKPCLLKSGSINYYLNPDDFTKKEDNTASILTGKDGDVMIKIPTRYWKWTWESDTVYTIEVSDKPFEGSVKYAHEVEDGYNLVPFYPLLLTQFIGIIMFKSTDGQGALGKGHTNDTSAYSLTGITDNKGMFYGTDSDTKADKVKFLGMEDFWGNKYWWIDGLVTSDTYDLLIGNKNFNDIGTGYTKYPSGISTNINGYIDKVQGGNEKGFILKSCGGSSSTHYCDYGNLYAGQVAYFGGHRGIASGAGAFCLRLYDSASDSNTNVGSRLFAKFGNDIFIGAYLGYEQNGKLRSISGVEPTGSKTIGQFRTLAKANN